ECVSGAGGVLGEEFGELARGSAGDQVVEVRDGASGHIAARNDAKHFGGDGIDAAGGNNIASERRAHQRAAGSGGGGGRVVDCLQRIGGEEGRREISGALRSRGDGGHERIGNPLPDVLVSQ